MKCCFVLTAFLAFVLAGCEKEQDREMLNAYFRYTINGNETVIKDGIGLNNNVFTCTIKSDTKLEIMASKVYENVGFYVTADSIKDGTYVLDDVNTGYFTNPVNNKRYTTSSTSKGTLTIKKDIFKAKSVLNILKGTFNFTGVDTLTGKTFNVTNGSFLMERKED